MPLSFFCICGTIIFRMILKQWVMLCLTWRNCYRIKKYAGDSGYGQLLLEMETNMKVIDLTHMIREDMPVYPGTETPKLIPANSYEKDGKKVYGMKVTVREAKFCMGKTNVVNARDIEPGGQFSELLDDDGGQLPF